nr:sugar phosphate isomerase/epimerase [Clostridia bacterium]
MKKIVTTTSVFPPCTDMEQTIRRLAKIGFDSLDIAFDYCTQDKNYPFLTDTAAWAEKMRVLAESLGICISHGHAPFDTAVRGPMVERTFRAASIMGVKYIVAHPVWRRDPSDGTIWGQDPSMIYGDTDDFIKVNIEYTKPLLEYAEKYGVTLLSENLLWCATIDPANIALLVDEVNSPYFGWCYDTGHARGWGHDFIELESIKTAPLSLHIQDNMKDHSDDHNIPGDGRIDWKGFAQTMNRIGYKGDVVLEAHHQSLELPDEERDAFLAVMLERAKSIQKDMND